MSDRETTRRSTDIDETDGRTGYHPNPNERGKWVSALIALIGIWMLIEPLFFEMADAQFWNDIIVGALLLAVGAYNYYRQMNEEYGSVGAASVAALIGLWLVVAPFVLGGDVPTDAAALDAVVWNDLVVGLLVLLLGAYSAYKIRDRRRTAPGAAT